VPFLHYTKRERSERQHGNANFTLFEARALRQ